MTIDQKHTMDSQKPKRNQGNKKGNTQKAVKVYLRHNDPISLLANILHTC